MLTEPEVVERAAQPYVAIGARVTMQTIGAVLPELHPLVFAWLAERGVSPVGDPFWKYNVIDMERELEVEVAAPVATAVDGDDRVLAGVIPSGRYATLSPWLLSATLRYTGHPDGLVGATASLLEWSAQQGLTFDARPAEGGDRWGARLEIYETDPAVEPDMTKWTTQLAFRLSD